MQGVGWLTLEDLRWDVSDGESRGRLATQAASTYKPPSFSEMPEEFNVSLLPKATEDGAVYGSKAVGEPPLMLAFSVREALRQAASAFGPRGLSVGSPRRRHRRRCSGPSKRRAPAGTDRRERAIPVTSLISPRGHRSGRARSGRSTSSRSRTHELAESGGAPEGCARPGSPGDADAGSRARASGRWGEDGRDGGRHVGLDRWRQPRGSGHHSGQVPPRARQRRRADAHDPALGQGAAAARRPVLRW